MKIWFNRDDVNFDKFTQEQFLIIGEFDPAIILKDKDFNNVEWIKQISKKVEIVNCVELADVILYPKKLDTQIYNYLHFNKKVLAFYNDDNDASIASDNIILFRTSIINSKKKQNEYSMPAWSTDFKQYIKYQKKQKIPTVGFCGAITHPIRQEIINNLKNDLHIHPNFIIRNNFWGGAVHNEIIRKEYIDNMINSDFIVCCRGAGNFSYRLYETMSMGKIPIIFDTDISLPCEDVINYNKFIKTSSLHDITRMIKTLWDNMSDETYIDLQKYSRCMYETYISPPAFTDYIYKIL